MTPPRWPRYFMAVGLDWETMDYAKNCGHFHKAPEDAIDCITKDYPTIQGVDVADFAFGIPHEIIRTAYEERGINIDEVLPPGFPRDNLPDTFPKD